MRLRVSLSSAGSAERDVVVTADVTATVGDVAAVLASHLDGPLTLRVGFPGRAQWRVLNGGALVHDSGLRSGCRVEPVPVGTRRDGDDVAVPSAAVARVISGPDAGAEFTLSPGVNIVGRRDPAQVVLPRDDKVSRRHASVTVADSIVVTDLNSANGMLVDGQMAHRAVATPSSRVLIGETELQFAPVPTTPGVLDSADGATGFVRSPRVEPAFRGERVVLPEIPAHGERPRFPMLAVLAPVILGLVLWLLTKQLYSLVFVALSPIIMLGTWIDNRVQNRRKRRDEAARFEEGISDAQERLEEARTEEVSARAAESPSIDEVVAAISELSPLVWTRKPEHSTFLEVRFGTGALPSRTEVQLPSKNAGGVEQWRRAKELADQFASVEPVPVVETFERAGAIGVAGAGMFAADAARAMVIQLAGLHSPADLVITALAAGDSTAAWDWLKWLPHVDSAYSPLRTAGLAADYPAASALLAELEGLVDRRRAAGVGRGSQVRSRLDESEPLDAEHGKAVRQLPAVPAVLLVVTEHAPADRGRLVALAEDGPDAGVFVLWLAAAVEALPVACRTFIEFDRDGDATGLGRVGFVRSGLTVPLARPELVGPIQAATTARLLAPVADTGARVLDETDLPRTVSFADLYGGEVLTDPGAVLQRWTKNDTLTSAWIRDSPREPGTLRAVVGQGPTEPFALDLRTDGPHALVGGTTGSGKSEFLQSWLMGIAVEHSPDRVTFLLVDYKGGSAFAECVGLPHTVGLVTDLTPHLVRRALTSLRAELRYRERLLNDKGAKDLIALERRGDADAPPALIIVIDEFAALASEVPEFVDGVIDIAQRGRSLGLHLVMATQRPSGVIKDSLRANTNLRVALRVADEADSVDVLGTQVAALFDPGTPGRAAAKLGPGRVQDFQTAYLGGRTRQGPSVPDVHVQELPFGLGSPWPQPAATTTGDAERDIERLAAAITRAADSARVSVPRKPWLDALPALVDIESLPRSGGAVIPIGLLDEPESQRQRPYGVDFDKIGNLTVIGTGGSGKSTLLRTIAFAASESAAEHPVAVYGIDFGGGALRILERLPTVGAVIDGGDRERVTRLLSQLATELESRSRAFAGAHAASLTDYRDTAGGALPRVFLLIDGFGAFRTEYEFDTGGSTFDRLLHLASVGRQLGIHLVLTADRAGAIPTGLSATIGERIVLRLAGDAEYAATGTTADALEDAPPGRALVAHHELQVSVPGGTADLSRHAEAFDALAARLHLVPPAPPVRRLADFIDATELPAMIDGRVVLGIADDTLEPATVAADGLFVITGPFGSGRTTATRTTVAQLRAARPSAPAYLLVARHSSLRNATRWTDVAADAEDAHRLAAELTLAINDLRPGDNAPVIVVENVGDFAGLPAEGTVAGLLTAARRAGVTVIAEADTVTAASAWQLYTELKTARAGLVLQPDEGDGIALFRVPFPRVQRTDFPPGRGILVDAGRIRVVQVAHTG